MTTILAPAVPNIPWQDRPAGTTGPIWRYDANPLITVKDAPFANSIFNSAVVPFNGAFAGIFRCDSRGLEMDFYPGFSDDGLHWEISDQRLAFTGVDGAPAEREYAYDPRVVKIDDRYYINWCTGYHGPTIGVGYTEDFRTFYQHENAFLPYNRNGVLFPRKINGNYAMLSRPSDTGHTPFGDIFYSESPDLTYWGKHRFVMGTRSQDSSGWQSTKIGAGPHPIETDEGWLLFYHGVITTANGMVYRMGGALLDRDEPWRVIARSREYLLGPTELYERVGDVPNVLFPCAALCDGETGRIAIYYGGADTVVGLAFTTVDEVVSAIRETTTIGK